jgi:GntR family transcriptional regulator
MNAVSEPELILQGGAPLHEQIADQLRASIACGLLHRGETLPTVRQVAVGLAIHPGAVERAYDQLEKEGWLNWEQGNGPYVSAPPAREMASNPWFILETNCRDLLARAECLGFTAEDVFRTLAMLHQRRLSS